MERLAVVLIVLFCVQGASAQTVENLADVTVVCGGYWDFVARDNSWAKDDKKVDGPNGDNCDARAEAWPGISGEGYALSYWNWNHTTTASATGWKWETFQWVADQQEPPLTHTATSSGSITLSSDVQLLAGAVSGSVQGIMSFEDSVGQSVAATTTAAGQTVSTNTGTLSLTLGPFSVSQGWGGASGTATITGTSTPGALPLKEDSTITTYTWILEGVATVSVGVHATGGGQGEKKVRVHLSNDHEVLVSLKGGA